MSQSLRIAICNFQTAIGTTKGYWQYLTTGWKYWLPHDSEAVRKAAAFIRASQVDVAAFCEIEAGSWRTRAIDQVALLSELTCLKQTRFFPTRTGNGRANQGNAICSRFSFRHVENHRLPGVGEPRFLSEGELRLDGQTIRVFVTHLSLRLGVRTAQIQRITERINECSSPAILAGDFNISRMEELDLLEKSILNKVTSAPTYPSWRPTRHLDHLFFTDHFDIISQYTFDDFLFSDHLPFVAEVRLKGTNG